MGTKEIRPGGEGAEVEYLDGRMGEGQRCSSTVVYKDLESITGFPSYRVGTDGSVWSFFARSTYGKPDRWNKLKCYAGKSGVVMVVLSDCGRTRAFTVASLVLRAFVGPRPIGCIPLHFPDTSPENCSVENLRWAPKGSQFLGVRRGNRTRPYPKGITPTNAILDEEKVREIVDFYRAGWLVGDIAHEYGVAPDTIRNIMRGIAWRRVTGGPVGRKRVSTGSILAESEITEIHRMASTGMTQSDIAREFGVTQCTISCILRGKTWKHIVRKPINRGLDWRKSRPALLSEGMSVVPRPDAPDADAPAEDRS